MRKNILENKTKQLQKIQKISRAPCGAASSSQWGGGGIFRKTSLFDAPLEQSTSSCSSRFTALQAASKAIDARKTTNRHGCCRWMFSQGVFSRVNGLGKKNKGKGLLVVWSLSQDLAVSWVVCFRWNETIWPMWLNWNETLSGKIFCNSNYSAIHYIVNMDYTVR